MEETLKMLKEIITGEEGKVNEKKLIEEYQKGLYPNILAYFFKSNYGIIINTNNNYPLLTDEDKASFCLQELDKCLQSFNLQQNVKFITYFIKCYKNRLRMESEQLLTQKRKILNTYDCIDDLEISNYNEDIDLDLDSVLNTYNLSNIEKIQCKLLEAGYTVKEIAFKLNVAPITIYKRNEKIKQKISGLSINFV